MLAIRKYAGGRDVCKYEKLKAITGLTLFKGIFRYPQIQSTIISTHTDFLAYSGRALLRVY